MVRPGDTSFFTWLNGWSVAEFGGGGQRSSSSLFHVARSFREHDGVNVSRFRFVLRSVRSLSSTSVRVEDGFVVVGGLQRFVVEIGWSVDLAVAVRRVSAPSFLSRTWLKFGGDRRVRVRVGNGPLQSTSVRRPFVPRRERRCPPVQTIRHNPRLQRATLRFFLSLFPESDRAHARWSEC